MNQFLPFQNSFIKNVQTKKVELLNLCQELKSVLSNSVVDFKYIKYDFKSCRIHIISISTRLFENSTVKSCRSHIISISTRLFENSTVNYILTLWFELSIFFFRTGLTDKLTYLKLLQMMLRSLMYLTM